MPGSLLFGADANPFFTVHGGKECFNISAIDDDVKEDKEQFKLLLGTKDPQVCFCKDLAFLVIQEDKDDGNVAVVCVYSVHTVLALSICGSITS